MSVATDNLSYFITDSVGKKLCLLHSVSVSFPASSVTCILGPSGAGKTTLMNLIAGVTKRGFMSGRIQVPDGHGVAYVECFDFHIAEFTVLQNLYFSGMLRCGDGKMMSYQDCVAHCEKTAAMVGLQHVLDVVVGSGSHKGISGGQQKLLSIANELLSLPAVVCLDEPTSGLDSLSSLSLAKYLRKLAVEYGKTVITTVHQPSADMLHQWDKLILVANDGHIAYEGPIFGVLDHFCSVGYEVSDELHRINPVEFALELLGEETSSLKLIGAWAARPRTNQGGDSSPDMGAKVPNPAAVKPTTRRSLPFHWQLWVLLQRNVLYNMLMLHGIKGKIVSNVFAGCLYGVLYHNNARKLWDLKLLYDPRDLTLSPWCYNIAAMCFSVPLYVILVNGPPIPQMFYMKRYCDKEQGMGLYNGFARWIAMTLVDIPLVFLGTCIFIWIVYGMIGLHQPWFRFAVCVMMPSLIGYAQSQFCAQISSSAINGFILFAVIGAYEIVFSGFLISKDSLQKHIRWMVYTTYTRWSTGQLMMNEYEDLLGFQGTAFLTLYNYENMEFWRSRDVLLGFFFGFQLLVFLGVIPWGGQIEMIPDADTDHMPHTLNETTVAVDIEAGCTATDNGDTDGVKNVLVEPQLETHFLSIEGKCPEHESVSGEKATALDEDDMFDDIAPLPASKQVRFSFHNIGYVVAGPKILLRNVDGFVNPGELTCVMGSTGSGKTTLLNILSGRANSGTIRGDILANGKPFLGMKLGNSIADDTSPSYAYVMQDDVHCALLTVRETLEFAALLRLRSCDSSAVEDMVTNILGILGLTGVGNCYVGTVQNTSLSRGQIRRLTVGVEIVLSPSMIFLDEPTTGLDSYLALTVVKCMKRLAQSQRTLLCTIHSPSPILFQEFDNVLLLSKGYLMYFGPCKGSQKYFQQLPGIEVSSSSPADFIIIVASEIGSGVNTCKLTLQEVEERARMHMKTTFPDIDMKEVEPIQADKFALVDTWSLLQIWRAVKYNVQADLEDVKKSRVTIKILLTREFLKEMRRWQYWVASTLRAVVIGCMLGYVFWNQPDNGNVLNRNGLFLCIFLTSNIWMVELCPTLHEEKLIFYREREANATSTFATWVVMGLPTMIAQYHVMLVFLLPIHYMVQLRDGTKHFLILYASSYLCMVSNLFLGHFIAAVTSDAMINVVIFPGTTLTLQSLFCGFSAMTDTFKGWFRWGTYVDPALWSMGIMFVNECHNNDYIFGPAFSYDPLIRNFGWNYPIHTQFLYLCLIILSTKLLSYFGYRYAKLSSA